MVWGAGRENRPAYPIMNLYWQYQSAPGRTAGVTATKDVRFTQLP